ncbi:MAG: transketolase [Devosiaceae bacterium]|nr:transketolase [Devosiaceae bacterium]
MNQIQKTKKSQKDMANAIRILSLDCVERAKSGHLGLPLGAADIATVLFTKFLKFDPKNPNWFDRDRFVLSAGHGSMLLYSALYLLGYKGSTIEGLKDFRQLGAKTAGHPEFGHLEGVETTTGPLGQGIANAVGMALSEEKLRAEFGQELVDHYTYCLIGDGCLMEGISHEACSLAGHLKLNKLIVLWDDNDITIDGHISLVDSTDQRERFKTYGWNVISIDGHNEVEIAQALTSAKQSEKPTLIACKTIAGFGAPTKAGKPKAHGGPYGQEEAAGIRENLGWENEPFDLPQDIVDAWRLAGLRSTKLRVSWEKQFEKLNGEKGAQFKRRLRGDISSDLENAILELKKQYIKDMPNVATRKSSQMALEIINPILSETMGGSADLAGSNLTKTTDMSDFSADERSGRFINYGVREHAMAAMMNGIALHGGLLPYSGGFFIFSDYARPAIRLAALMEIRTIHVMTHDSIGVGEDGPTHQPVEHLASFRAMPNIKVYRPSDASETAECWQLALNDKTAPAILALSRQGTKAIRAEFSEKNLCAKGAYSVIGNNDADIVIFASGTEVAIALDAYEKLLEQNISARVVSVPCFELFYAQDEDYQRCIKGSARFRIGIEAGVRQGWDRLLGDNGIFIGMDSFGASAPASDLYQHFNISAAAIVDVVKQKLSD